MTTPRLSDPERWTERSAGGRAAEDVLGAALRRARAAVEPSEVVLARVESGFVPVTSVAASGRWRVALATLAGLLAISGTVGAARGPLRGWAVRHGLLAPVAPIEVTPPQARPQAHAAAKAVALVTPAPAFVTPPPEVAPAREAEAPGEGTAAPLHQPAPARARRALGDHDAVEPPPAPLAPQPPAVADEARILRGVFAGLRSGAVSGVAALSALDDYDRRFPAGLLRAEARLARVEALLGLGWRSDALALLDAWDKGGLALTRSARTARGELRAEAGRCAEAEADFSVVLAGAGSAGDRLGGSALYGRASCALRAGDAAAAAAVLTRYLAEHADGPQATQAREALARLNGRSPSP